MLLADMRIHIYQVRWRPLSSYPAWQRVFIALAVLLRFDTLWAVWGYRFKRFFLRWQVPILPRLIDRFLATAYQVQIGDHVYIGPGLYIPHGFVVMDGFVEIGRNCTISPFVTFGLRNSAAGGFSFVGPCAGDGLWVGTHSMLLGDIELGDHVTVGANSMLLHDLPGHCTAAGSPAKVVRTFTEAELDQIRIIQEIGFQA